MSENRLAILIPIYKEPNDFEKISLANISRIHNDYKKIFIAPKKIKNKRWLKNLNIRNITFFENGYFKDISGYNKLLLSPIFYFKFLRYRYILIFQLDCYILRPELLKKFIAMNYHYFGAPWVTVESQKREIKVLQRKRIVKFFSKNNKIEPYVGNGGLSLRNTKIFFLCSVILFYYAGKWKKIKGQEDVFWSIYAPAFIPFFKKAPYELAITFSFDEKPEVLFEETKEYPYGIHSWSSYSHYFWKNHLNLFSKDID